MGLPSLCSFWRKLRLLVDGRRESPNEVLDGEEERFVGEEKAEGREGRDRHGCAGC